MAGPKAPVRQPPSPSGVLHPAEARIVEEAWSHFPGRLPSLESAPEAVRAWFEQLLAVFLPLVDGMDELPDKAAFVFGFDPDQSRAMQANSAVLSADSARTVLAELADRARAHAGPVRPEDFKRWMNEIKAATGAKGAELLHPVRIALTGAFTWPEFEKLVPLIEEGAALGLGIPSVCERIERFVGV